MLTYDEIVEYVKENGLRNLMTPYQGNNGVGVMYSVEIEDYGKTEPRLAIFDGIAELARFADQMKISDKVITNEHGLIVSEPRFMLRGKILTTQSLSVEKKRKRTLEATKKEYYEYKRRRLSVISKKIEIIKKEIEELEKTIKHFSKKGAILFRGTLSDKNIKNITSLFEFDIADLPADSGSFQDLVRLKITYNTLRRKKELLQRKLDILSEYSQKGFLKKLVSSQKEISDLLSTVDTQIGFTLDVNEFELLKYENILENTLIKYEARPVIPELHLFLLNYLKNIDSLPLEYLSEAYITQESINLDSTIKNAGKDESKYKLKQSAPTQEEKDIQLLTALKNQYDTNLTNEKKDAIETVQDIPQDSIVLPEDVTVYRGVDSRYLRNPQCIAVGPFIATSLRPKIALSFGGDQPTLYKIQLKKGTPVKISPNKVFNDMELLLISQDMQDFEITESIVPIIHYQFENGEFVENKSGFIITGEMEPKVFKQVRQDIEIENVV